MRCRGKAISRLPRHQKQQNARQKLRQANQAKIERAMGQRVNLPAHGDRLHLAGDGGQQARRHARTGNSGIGRRRVRRLQASSRFPHHLGCSLTVAARIGRSFLPVPTGSAAGRCGTGSLAGPPGSPGCTPGRRPRHSPGCGRGTPRPGALVTSKRVAIHLMTSAGKEVSVGAGDLKTRDRASSRAPACHRCASR